MIEAPSPDDSVLDSVSWGHADQLFTPAFWYVQFRLAEVKGFDPQFRLGTTLAEEIVACLISNHGIQAELGAAVFENLRHRLFTASPDSAALQEWLREPVLVQGRTQRYRFWKTKADYILNALDLIETTDLDSLSPLELREQLTGLSGIGPKTASWIVRNWTGSNEVAILDVHVTRALHLMGLWDSYQQPVGVNYFRCEELFLVLAQRMEAEASKLDSFLWHSMRGSSGLARDLLCVNS